jgi:nucleotide-binding universal stress UspA family protein
MISKILIATDGSTTAGKAVEIGCDLAAKYGAEVVLLHILLRGEVSENLRHMAEIEFAEAERGQAAEIQREKRIAHQKAVRRWQVECQLAQLEESRRKLERAKAEELQARRKILFGWRKDQKAK